MDKNKSTNREDYFRCPMCKGLFLNTECYLDPIKGYICPNNCERSYQQPPYESPLQNDDN